MHTFPQSLEHPAQTISRDQRYFSVTYRRHGDMQTFGAYIKATTVDEARRLWENRPYAGTCELVSIAEAR